MKYLLTIILFSGLQRNLPTDSAEDPKKKTRRFDEQDVVIDPQGNYSIAEHVIDGKPATTEIHPLRLILLSCDATLEHVELAKQEFNGRTRQIEVLTVSKDKMMGYAKHDEHTLIYVRR